jgi:cytoskeletal protein CcmA (bactofilin family)
LDESKTRAWTNFRMHRTPSEPEAFENDPQEVSHIPVQTFFDSGAIFEGTLKLTGDFRIDSEFRGELATDGVIVVGASGSVEGKITARQVEIEGAVVGDVKARRMLVLRASGRLHGNVETACFEIERHAFFQGTTRMIHPLATGQLQKESAESAEFAESGERVLPYASR